MIDPRYGVPNFLVPLTLYLELLDIKYKRQAIFTEDITQSLNLLKYQLE